MADNWLKEYGFNAVQLPRRDLAPADVLFRQNGDFRQKVGKLSMLFSSTEELLTGTGEPVVDIGRTIEKKVEVGVGLKILGALFGAVGSSKLGAETKVQRARNLVKPESLLKKAAGRHDSVRCLERAPVQYVAGAGA